MKNVSPITGNRQTVFYADLSQTKLNLTTVEATISSGHVYIVDINPLTNTVSFKVKDSINGNKTITFVSGEFMAQVTIIYELPQLARTY